MLSFSDKDGIAITLAMIDAIAANRQKLSDIDGLIGDGDHGINMHKGFRMCGEQIDVSATGFSESLRLLGGVLMEKIGGAMGPLYGSLFSAMGRACKDTDRIDAGTFAAMLRSAESKVRAIGQCERGDKTILDALAPASDAFAKAVDEGADFEAALGAMAAAAAAGRDATIDMVARKGRSSRLGERSKGVPDAGATSCCVILTTMADAIGPLLH